jgi:AraC-like DNA-binding protein
MQRVAAAGELRPGTFVAGKSWLMAWADKGPWCIVFFGRPDREDATSLIRVFLVELEAPRHPVLVDALALEGIDPGAFEQFQIFARENLERSREKVERLALVLPRGVSGAVVAGFYGVLGAPCEIQTFEARSNALGWLGVDLDLEDAIAEARGLPPLLGQLRAHLKNQLADAEIARAALNLGVSERTLQRRLTEAGTSFVKELQIARVDEAKRRLIESDDAITSIAIECGFASSQHFSRQFRTVAGVSPTEFRARHKTAAPTSEPS